MLLLSAVKSYDESVPYMFPSPLPYLTPYSQTGIIQIGVLYTKQSKLSEKCELMIDFTLGLAGLTVAVHALHEGTARYCDNFIIDPVGTPDIAVTITQADIDAERIKARRTDEQEGISPRLLSDAFLELTAVQRKITEELFLFDVLLFHGSVVAVDGTAYLFTAKSGTGKSTHTRLWRELLGTRAVMVNDDKPFLRFTEKGVLAYGSPWNGKHRLGSNIRVPLRSICILERGQKNHIQEISPKYALPMLIQQSSRPMNGALMGKYMELIDLLSSGVRFYRMRCNMELAAAELAFTTMSEQ